MKVNQTLTIIRKRKKITSFASDNSISIAIFINMCINALLEIRRYNIDSKRYMLGDLVRQVESIKYISFKGMTIQKM